VLRGEGVSVGRNSAGFDDPFLYRRLFAGGRRPGENTDQPGGIRRTASQGASFARLVRPALDPVSFRAGPGMGSAVRQPALQKTPAQLPSGLDVLCDEDEFTPERKGLVPGGDEACFRYVSGSVRYDLADRRESTLDL